MVARITWSAVLAIIMIPVVSVGLMDPLEGLAALIMGIALAVTARLLSKQKLPKLAWIPFAIAAALMAVVLPFAIFGKPENVMAETQTPIAFALVIALWVQGLVIVLMDVGIIIYVVRLFRARAAARDDARVASKAT